ncbi:MAG: ribose 5-phosphate isomerase B [Clostridia bacterium]
MISIGCDHGGFELKETIIKHLTENNILFKDFGIYEEKSCDYPDIASVVAKSIQKKEASLGILICGTGIGMSISANKFKNIRAACCSDTFSARYTRMHNNANILCIGGRVIGSGLAIDMIDLFLNTEFEGGRHQLRLDKISAIEMEENYDNKN